MVIKWNIPVNFGDISRYTQTVKYCYYYYALFVLQ
jgi:hypothetical protein